MTDLNRAEIKVAGRQIYIWTTLQVWKTICATWILRLLQEMWKMRSDLFGSGPSHSSSSSSSFHVNKHDSLSNSIGGGINLNNGDDGGNGNHSNGGIGASTALFDDDKPMWDGFGKFSNVPIHPDVAIDSQPQLTKEELLREKFKYIKNWKI